jgi:diguanylate cyclase (GGDEF)-like protein/PAS domain S-box-containing protein
MHTEVISDFARTAGISLAFMLTAMVIVPSIALLLRTRVLISHPLDMIKEKIRDIANDHADLNEQIPSDQKDEIGDLARWFNVLSAKLSRILDEKDEVITKNVEIKQSLAKEKEFFQTTVNSIGDAVITMDVDGIVITMNDAAENITAFTKTQIIGQHFSRALALIQEKCRTPLAGTLEAILAEGIAMACEDCLLLAADGAEKHIAFHCSPILCEDGVALGAVLIFRDISESKAQTKKMEYLSYHDSLTGLHNRAFFEHTCEILQQKQHVPVAVIMGDANGLKQANDLYGHGAGDMLLQTIAQAFKSACRSEDVIARWGGDEFTAVLPGLTRERAEVIMDKIHAYCANARIEPVTGSVSLGLAIKDSPETPLSEVLKAAEEQMYKAKQAYKRLSKA